MSTIPIARPTKQSLIFLSLLAVEVVAAGVWWWSMRSDAVEIASRPIAAARPRAGAAPLPIDLRFLAETTFQDYQPDPNRNPFKGPVAPVKTERPRPPRTPRPPDPPNPPKQQIEIVFRGLIVFLDGRQSALVEDRFKNEQHFMQVGDPLYSWTVSRFDYELLVLQRSDGSTKMLPRTVSVVIGEQ